MPITQITFLPYDSLPKRVIQTQMVKRLEEIRNHLPEIKAGTGMVVDMAGEPKYAPYQLKKRLAQHLDPEIYSVSRAGFKVIVELTSDVQKRNIATSQTPKPPAKKR